METRGPLSASSLCVFCNQETTTHKLRLRALRRAGQVAGMTYMSVSRMTMRGYIKITHNRYQVTVQTLLCSVGSPVVLVDRAPWRLESAHTHCLNSSRESL